MQNLAAKIHTALVNAGFKIDSVCIPIPNNKSTWVIETEDDISNFIADFDISSLGSEDVKAECRRRILLIMTEDQQRNTLAAGQAAMMQYGADLSDWPDELRTRQQTAMTAWSEIERLRARSNEIEKLDPLPTDFTNDELWEPAP